MARRGPLAILLGGLAAAAGGEPTRVIDLATFGTPTGALTRIYGSSGEGRLGVPVAGGFDVDDDGHPDSAIAAVAADPFGREEAGEVLVIFGDGTLGGSVTTTGFDAGVLKIAGAHEWEIAGVEIEIADVTGDGVGDLLIGRQNHSPSPSRQGAGALTILVGGEALRDHAETLSYLDLNCVRPGAPVDCPELASGLTAITFVGAMSYDRLGIWMRAGDVDGDGIDDIVVGADEVDVGAGMVVEQNRGAAYVIRGGAHLAAGIQTIDMAEFGLAGFPDELDPHVARLEPPSEPLADPPGAEDYHFGATCQIGDLDGNGKGEVLVAAALNRLNATLRLPGAPAGTGSGSGGALNGHVFIAWDDHFPATPWAAGYTIVLGPSANTTRLRGSNVNPDNQTFGEEMLAGRDYDGDGLADLFVGDLAANTANGNFSGLGHVFFNAAELKGLVLDVDGVIAAPPAGMRHTLIIGPSPVAIGADTATDGDYDGDGIADLAVCNPKDDPVTPDTPPPGRDAAGTVHVLFGEIGGWPATIDLKIANLPSPAAVRIVEIQGAEARDGTDGGDTLCYSAAGGDVDSDGVRDLLVNEMEGNGYPPETVDPDPALEDVGNLLLLSGAVLLDKFLLDVDDDDEARALTDGVLLLRSLSDIGLPDLVVGTEDPGAQRSDAEIETYLERAGAAIDVDGDDALDPDTDGVLALRYLFEFRGASLTDGIAFGPGATRTTPAAIEAFLDRLMP